MNSITLYQNWFLTGREERDFEYKKCLSLNCNNPKINKIVLLCEKKDLEKPIKSDKVDFRYVEKRPTYRDFFELANEEGSLGEVSILANTDIYFDFSLSEVYKLLDDKTFVALTRYENGKIGETHWSQDVWVWKNKVNHKDLFCDFFMGILGCDNRIAFELSKNYNVINPCRDIMTYHVHSSQIRTYGQERIPRPYKEVLFENKIEPSLDNLFMKFRPKYEGCSYPPYHNGDYFEEYFYKFYVKNKKRFDEIGVKYIPVFWTNIYLSFNGLIDSLQKQLSSISKNVCYFTVSQHDDAIKEILPPKTIHFNMGGNTGVGIPTPLICSPIKEKYDEIDRPILCSFVGSDTHPIRKRIIELFANSKKIAIKTKSWKPDVSSNELDTFVETTLKSKFCLCPRGYGKNSFRFSEALQLGAVPVYVYDKTPFLPFGDMIDYSKFCVLVEEANLPSLERILDGYSERQIEEMQRYGKQIWENHFSMEGCCKTILSKLVDIRAKSTQESSYYVRVRPIKKTIVSELPRVIPKPKVTHVHPIYAPWRT